MAFRFFYSSKVWHNLFRLHNYFSKKNHSRAYNLADQAHHTHNGVYLRKIPAWCVQLFPDIGNRINSDYINSLVCKDLITGQEMEAAGVNVPAYGFFWLKKIN